GQFEFTQINVRTQMPTIPPEQHFLRFSDLVARGIVNNRVTLSNWIATCGFPPGRLIGPNTRAWTDSEVAEWLTSRPSENATPKRGAVRKNLEAHHAECNADNPTISQAPSSNQEQCDRLFQNYKPLVHRILWRQFGGALRLSEDRADLRQAAYVGLLK